MDGSHSPTLVLCTSASFYKKAVGVQVELVQTGFRVVIPAVAEQMKVTGDYDVSHYKTWLADPNDYAKKAQLIHGHFDEIAAGDAVIVLNEKKNGTANYIGGNVLMEIAIAFHLRKPIFVINDLPEGTPYDEELRGLLPVVLHGKLKELPNLYQAATQAAAQVPAISPLPTNNR